MLKSNFLFLFILFVFVKANAQDTISLIKGMVVASVSDGVRTAVFTDKMYHQLFTDSFKEPNAGDVFGIGRNGAAEKWTDLNANERGVFDSPKLRGGYLYLTYVSAKAETKLLKISGHAEIYVNGIPHAGDVYNKHILVHPIQLKKGKNTFLIKGSRGQVNAKLLPVKKGLSFMEKDFTNPDFLIGDTDVKIGSIRILNATDKTQRNLKIVTEINGVKTTTVLPAIVPLTLRKVAYNIKEIAATEKDKIDVVLKLYEGSKLLDQTNVLYNIKGKNEMYTRTFISNIDGSVQYFSIVESSNKLEKNQAMFLSLHGAAVEGRAHASTYKAKDWGHIIAPTNRRDFGFDWEDWGRWDAMEVQQIAEKMYGTNSQKTYLTGHSMGGHGTWQLGVTFPGKWAAIAPIAGWSSLFSYANKEQVNNPTPLESMFVRASNSSNTLALGQNFLQEGVYISHGDSDKTVDVAQARLMREFLAEFHPDFAYQEYPGKPHWFGVDFPQIFNYFKWHENVQNEDVERFEFKTASPGVSASNHFITLYQQEKAFEFSGVKVSQNILSAKAKKDGEVLKTRAIQIKTENLVKIKLDLAYCKGLENLSVKMNAQSEIDISQLAGKEAWLVKENGSWILSDAPNSAEKSPQRDGNFKDAFKNNMLFVYGTKGTAEENEWAFNKARFDAETFYYRGNGSIDIISDKEFSLNKYKDRSVILFGNASTNAAWEILLAECPIQVKRGEIKIAGKTLKGENLGAYFIYPRKDSSTGSVGVITGTGKQGFAAVTPNRYFSSGVGIPDVMIFTADMYKNGLCEVKVAGYFGNDWSVNNGDFVWNVS